MSRRPKSTRTRSRSTVPATLLLIAVVIFLVARSGVLRLDLFGNLEATPATGSTVTRGSETSTGATSATAEVRQQATTPAAETPGTAGSPTPQGVLLPASTAVVQPTANAPPTPRSASGATTRVTDLPAIAYAELPAEAHATIQLILQDGPFPFDRDGITFENRERLLPANQRGYYREYTVPTPGISHRGARRIVTGAGGEMYYTEDHYASFSEIIR
jgi:ribonuclease T1